MIIRAKADMFKSKLYDASVDLNPHKPYFVKEVLASPPWL